MAYLAQTTVVVPLFGRRRYENVNRIRQKTIEHVEHGWIPCFSSTAKMVGACRVTLQTISSVGMLQTVVHCIRTVNYDDNM